MTKTKSEIISSSDYIIVNRSGEIVPYKAVVDKAVTADVLFIGETHNNPIAHKLEESFLKDIHTALALPENSSSGKKPVLSLEFFETDVQIIIDEYLNGLISEHHFRNAARTWPNYKNTHRPLIEYARTNAIGVIAANAPRRYVNRVARLGRESLDDLSDTAKSWLPPLPYREASDAYTKKLDEIYTKISDQHSKKPEKDHGTKTTLPTETARRVMEEMKNSSHRIDADAQALWDAMMAWSIARALNKNENSLVLNINGSFHSEDRLGIPEHLSAYRPGTEIVVITIKPSPSFPKTDKKILQADDFIIYTKPPI